MCWSMLVYAGLFPLVSNTCPDTEPSDAEMNDKEPRCHRGIVEANAIAPCCLADTLFRKLQIWRLPSEKGIVLYIVVVCTRLYKYILCTVSKRYLSYSKLRQYLKLMAFPPPRGTASPGSSSCLQPPIGLAW